MKPVPMKIILWEGLPQEQWQHTNCVAVDIVLPDGRDMQLTVHADGTYLVRGWPDIPLKVGNADVVTHEGRLPALSEFSEEDQQRLLGYGRGCGYTE